MAEVGLALTETKKIPITAALRDVGWLPGLFSACVGGPSILSILQAVFVEHRLIAAFQWIVDGWNGILEVAAVIVEPVLVFLLGLLNAVFGWDLALYPHWRPLASIGFVFPLAWLRATWRDGDYTLLRAPAWMTLGALLGAASAGLVPLESSWRVQGLAAALPISMIYCMLTFAIPSVLTQQVPALRGEISKLAWVSAIGCVALIGAIVSGSFIFLVAAGLSLVPGVAQGAGVLTLVAIMGGIGSAGLIGLLTGKVRHLTETRVCLTILGGFITAGAILVADAAVKALT